LLPQISERAGLKWNQLKSGGALFLRGFIKKVCIADSFAIMLVDPGFANVEQYNAEMRVCIMLAYSFQIYFDFSGYSDMAIGTGKIMGFDFPVNFKYPYRSASFSEFWTRWHISLSSWLRDYLYIPLGGNRCSTLRQVFNLMFTMLLGGLWHGASWMFVLWGGLHGLALVLQRLCSHMGFLNRVPNVVKILIVFCVTTLLWVPFRSAGLEEVLSFWSAPFELSVVGIVQLADLMRWEMKLLFVIAFSSHFLMAIMPKSIQFKSWPMPIKVVLWATLLFWMLHFYPEQADVQPFIYFQF